MASTPCINCGQPLPAGAAFCGNCGARQTPALQNAPTQFQPPAPSGQGATVRADTPPTQDPYAAAYAPPPPPGGYSQYSGSGSGVPGANPAYPQPFDQKTQLGPPPGYAPGPPPPVGPGGVVAPWAQAQKGSGRRAGVGRIVAITLLLIVLVGGGVLAFLLLKGHSSANTPSSSSTSQTGGTNPSPTSQAGGTNPNPTTPPTASTTCPKGQQVLNNLHLRAIYAGVTITMICAVQEKSDPQYQPADPSMNVLKIKAKLDNSMDSRDVYVADNTAVVGPDGTPYSVATSNPHDSLPLDVSAQAHPTGYWYFAVPGGTHISDWQVVLGANNEVQETIPLNGAGYDGAMWNETPKPIGKSVSYYGGAIVGTVVKVATGVWTPGYQAPQGMRFILVDLAVMNTTATDVYVGDPEFVLLGPDGSRYSQDDTHGYLINDDLGAHANKDEGYACFVVPPAKGDFQMVFFNQNNGVAGMIDLGTL